MGGALAPTLMTGHTRRSLKLLFLFTTEIQTPTRIRLRRPYSLSSANLSLLWGTAQSLSKTHSTHLRDLFRALTLVMANPATPEAKERDVFIANSKLQGPMPSHLVMYSVHDRLRQGEINFHSFYSPAPHLPPAQPFPPFLLVLSQSHQSSCPLGYHKS